VASAAVPQSTLAEENQWFKEAAEAGRNGDVNGALTRLDQLLREHPQSPLAQTALVRKFRLLAKAGRLEEARREAQRYVAAYPTGFALTEAQALESGATTGSAPPAERQEQQEP
jgi:outer membrane protein assembly factor BamD (BamD/ComL family)